MSNSESSSMGCIAKGLIIFTITGIVAVVSALLVGRYVLMHTAVPAKGMAALLNSAPNIQIDGIEGSASSGFSVQTIRLTDDDGNENALDDARLKYDKKGDAFIITEIHVGRGHFYFDSSTVTESESNENDVSISSDDGTSAESGGDDFQFIIEKASINDVTVEDVATGKTYHLKGIQLEDLQLGKNNDLGKFVVESTNCSISILPKEGPIPEKQYVFQASFQPEFHEDLLAPLDLNGSCDVTDPDNVTVQLSALNNKIQLQGSEDNFDLTVQDVSLDTYFKDAPPVRNLTIKASGTEKTAKAKGAFLFNDKRFEINQELIKTEGQEKASLSASYKGGDTTYTIEYGGDDDQKLRLKTDPKTSLLDALSNLLTNKSHADLDAAEKARISKLAEHFSVDKKTTE